MEEGTPSSPSSVLGPEELRRPRLAIQEDMGASVSSATTDTSGVHRSRAPSARRRAETQDSDKAGRSWARHVDDAWWPCILTLDGGGIRGYSSLLILQALMHEVWIWEQRLEQEDSDTANGTGLTVADVPSSTTVAEGTLSGALPGARADAERVEGEYGVTGPLPPPENLYSAPAFRTVHQDRLTTSVSAKKASSEEELLPCHYFDFMYGTSTGGLIATILGRLRMTVSEGLGLYRKVGDDLFGRRRTSVPLMTKYYHEPLEKAVQDIVGARCHDHRDCDGKDDLHPWDTDHFDEILGLQVPFDVDRPRVCQSCCLAATHDQNISEAYLLRSYPHYYTETAPNWITRYNEGADELPIWKVTRATTAAPFYFELVEHEIEGVQKSFKDGGIRENNPSGAALSEFHSLYVGRAETPALMLSVGTGLPDQSQDGFATAGAFGWLPFVTKFLEKRAVVQNLLIKYTEGEKQHHSMRDYAHGENTWYKRLNVSDGLQNMALDDWRRGGWRGEHDRAGGASLSHMEEVTESYLTRDYDPAVDSYAPPRTMLVQAAEKLVRQRRARERMGGERWETFIGSRLHRRRDDADGDL